MVLLTPLLFAAMFVVVQVGLLYHARHVALAAAQEGARIARAADSTDAQAVSRGEAGALDYLDRIGGDLLSHPAVHVTRAGGRVHVDISGQAAGILPWPPMRVHAQAGGVVEEFRP